MLAGVGQYDLLPAARCPLPAARCPLPGSRNATVTGIPGCLEAPCAGCSTATIRAVVQTARWAGVTPARESP
ncbi:hypothetical protein [Streptomyces sp. GQFP]|uniref:hypothetical protein n=1 Tax=Streptomyces sp. GQFP TaxID=2907545 RepID=UPI001F43ECBD|nr:hypothetical protein [Streptomyces sp. GQFP]UIX32441.1 hypothetical protein LUX31_21710 [Streptomyces sp. GQFP]